MNISSSSIWYLVAVNSAVAGITQQIVYYGVDLYNIGFVRVISFYWQCMCSSVVLNEMPLSAIIKHFKILYFKSKTNLRNGSKFEIFINYEPEKDFFLSILYFLPDSNLLFLSGLEIAVCIAFTFIPTLLLKVSSIYLHLKLH